LRELYRTCWRFKNCISTVIVFDILGCVLQRDVQGCSHAAGNNIGASGCIAVAEALPHLLALQKLRVGGNCFMIYLGCVFQRDVQGSSHAAGNNIGASGCIAVAGDLPHLLALQVLNLEGDCF
jgi:hypothetical protein